MKTIQPIQIFQKTATRLNTYVVNDNLKDAASFYYCLYDDSNSIVYSGNLLMSGTDYEGYLDNDYAFNYVASKLQITITGDYVEPVKEKQTKPEQTADLQPA